VNHYYLGLDLGQSSDYTALAIVEEPLWLGAGEITLEDFGIYPPETVGENAGWISPSRLTAHQAHLVVGMKYRYGRPAHPPLYLRHLQRFELGTSYSDIVQAVKKLLLREPIGKRLKRTRLLVDKTGVGAAVTDGFRSEGVRPIEITIHGGENLGTDPYGFRVPKRSLVAAVQILLQNHRLKIAGHLRDAETLRRELENFRQKMDPKTAHESYSHWREGDHDDLVIAVAMAAWYREYINRAAERRNIKQGGFNVRGPRKKSQYENVAVYPG